MDIRSSKSFVRTVTSTQSVGNDRCAVNRAEMSVIFFCFAATNRMILRLIHMKTVDNKYVDCEVGKFELKQVQEDS